MKTFILLSLAFTAVFAAPAIETDPFIVGGVNAIPGEFPFIVSLQWTVLGVSTHVCGGTILNAVWILTAAHCMTDTPTLGRIVIHSGRHSLAAVEGSQVSSEIDRPRSIIHPDWVAGGVGPDDLALIRLQVPLTFNDRIRPARMPQAHAIPSGPGVLSGWGSTGGQTLPSILQKAIMPIISLNDCRNAIFNLGLNGALVDDTNICTGPITGGMSACSGDSGGPIVQGSAPNEVVVGIVSWGITPCGTVGAPSGVFKRVSAFNNWIFANTGISA